MDDADDMIPGGRLGRMLRAGRRRQRLSLRVAARAAGLDRATLAAYERGALPVPDGHLTELARLYGGTVAGLLPLRVPVRVADGRIAAGGAVRVLASGARDEVLGGYVELIGRLRGARPGDPLPLRADDLEALAAAIGADTVDVEARIVELVGCSREEAAALHREMLRRRLLAPVATLALGAAVIAGALPSGTADAPRPLERAEPASVMSDGAPAPAPEAPAPGAPSTPSTTSTPSTSTPSTSTPTTAPEPSPAPPAPPPPAPPPTSTPSTPSTTAPAEPPAPAPPGEPPPDVSVPPGEQFVEIGEPLVVDAPDAQV